MIDDKDLVPSEVKLVERADSLEKTKAELLGTDETLTDKEKNEKVKELLGS
jgi:hypothetical protein